jgi:hydroxymethylpyrimidine pyrophosphatase-like HAD family hydrolase
MMRYQLIATDYDGTLAHNGQVDDETWAAIATFRQRGGRVVLVTGREFDDLRQTCPPLERFDAVIAENGGVIYWPATQALSLQGQPPPAHLIRQLRQQGVEPIHLGRVIMATWQPYGEQVQQSIDELQLPYQVILNKRAVMMLPVGVDKASSLHTVLQAMHLAPEVVVGVGDAENDLALLKSCGLGVAVANALPALQAIADVVTEGDRGQGVQELIHQLMTAT